MEKNSNIDVLLAMQSALFSEITSELRAVDVNVDNENRIFYADFYYTDEASEKMLDLWDCIICEASAHFTYHVEQSINRLDYPQSIPLKGRYAYMRKESIFNPANIEPIFDKKIIDIMKKMPLKTLELLPFEFLTQLNLSQNAYLRLITQEALLGQVEPNLREISLEWMNDFLFVHFYYDENITISNEESVENVMNHIKSYMHPKAYLEKRVIPISQK